MANDPTEKLTYAKACELVGGFMNGFAYLESDLNDSLAQILSLGQIEAIIVTNNMQMRGKLHALKTVINLRGVSEDWRAQAITTANAIGTIADERNIVAHVPFGVDDARNTVHFLPVRAKGKLNFPEMHWTEGQFLKIDQKIRDIRAELETITHRIVAGQTLIKADRELTSGGQISPETQSFLIRLLQGNPNPDIATPEVAPETDKGLGINLLG
jgi:hypothetical protein